MTGLHFSQYALQDNEAALALEDECTQGTSVVLKYKRPTFHARSEVYSSYRIICARMDGRLVGTAAWAEKQPVLHGVTIRAAYLYDLRVHPAYRRRGVPRELARALFEDIGDEADCIYTLVAGENERCLKPARRLYGMKLVLPLTYVIVPVFRPRRVAGRCGTAPVETIHRLHLLSGCTKELVPEFQPGKLLGHVTSLSIGNGEAGCSVWSNETLLAEQIVRVPRRYELQRRLGTLLQPFVSLPHIPRAGEAVRSWFLFDLFANSTRALRDLLGAAHSVALSHRRDFLYILLQSGDPVLTMIKSLEQKVFTLPYCFLAKGRRIPRPSDRIYIDVRDL